VHHRVLGPAVEFGHEFNGIVCNAADLDAPNPAADPVLARYSQKLLAPALARSARFVDRVRQLIVLLLPRGLCRVEVVAQHLGVDRRTVHRKLQDEGTSFSALLEAERRALCSRYVEGTDRPLTEVAALLGYTAPSVFSRWHSGSFGISASRRRDEAGRATGPGAQFSARPAP
jgi:AraC-like DNA-binding protein